MSEVKEAEGAAPPFDLADAVARAQAGERAALEAIFRRFADPLFRYLYARCGDAGLAEELSGDLWVRVVEHLPGFRFKPGAPDRAFAAWLYRIAHNLLINSYTRKEAGNLSLDEALPAPDSGLELVLVKEEQQELLAALQRLTAEQREIVVLRFVAEHSTTEVAQLTGRSEGAVRVMQFRALKSLARLLGGRRKQRP